MNSKEKILVLALLLAMMPGVALAESTIMEELGSKDGQNSHGSAKV